MKKINLFLLLIMCGLFCEGLAQSVLQPSSNENRLLKYWYYRHRLNTDFMLQVGSNNGQSLVADIRDPNWDVIRWGDATISQAYYISVLALEFRAFYDRGVINTETLDELFFAIETINRLDYHAEAPYSYPNALDGFFLKDDVGDGLYLPGTTTLNNTAWAPYVLNLNTNAHAIPINIFESDWQKYHTSNGVVCGFEMSKDQIIHMYFAFALVKACLPSNITCYHSLHLNKSCFYERANALH